MTARGWVLAGVVAASILLVPLTFAPILTTLNLVLMKVDLLAFGGGFTTIPLIQREVVDRFGWVTTKEFIDGIALGQVTPGPIVITATFVGYLLGGPLGGIVATLGILLPSFLMVVAISPYFDRLRASPKFNKVIGGVLGSFVGLLLTVTIRFAANVHWDWAHLVLAGGAFIALLLSVDLLWVVLVSILASAAMFTWLGH